MNYQQAEAFHEKAKAYGSILGLDNIRRLMYELGDVWKTLNIIHVAGTNGKGSVCCFLASMLKEAGYRVGQYNSPAVFSHREIYRINGEEISKEEYAACMERVKYGCEKLAEQGKPHPTVFEVETALAFLWFAEKKCDIVILEVGMGGSTDATNLITHPLCSVITSISRDHMKYLGDSIGEIAKIKSGIIKEGCPVVTAIQREEAAGVIYDCAKEKHAPCYVAADLKAGRVSQGRRKIDHPEFGGLQLSMLGSYQVENAALAIEVIDVLNKNGSIQISADEIRQGMLQACWRGRFERVSKEPLIYLDGAHNLDGTIKLKETLSEGFGSKKKIGIMGVMADKEYRKMVQILGPLFSKIYAVTPDNPRALPGEKLAEEIRALGFEGIFFAEVRGAVKAAYFEALSENSMVMVFGSLYYLNEVREALHEITGD
ncbi:MAG: bifunctional folylpolyglutamate synthase/dihydrofolate synthase [Roseburia sp.]|nr:bifunctional folylpolyglutamate synthase/dihydrofolate synthase [Roseburia sp.]